MSSSTHQYYSLVESGDCSIQGVILAGEKEAILPGRTFYPDGSTTIHVQPVGSSLNPPTL